MERLTSSPVLLLTATVQVSEDMCFTPRRDTDLRLADYLTAFRRWLASPAIHSMVLVENSGYDLTEFRKLADAAPEKQVELLSFPCPTFDGSRGKGYGEMLCLEHCLKHSELLAQSGRFLKVSGRYFLLNAAPLMQFFTSHPEVDVVCNLLGNLSWADSRAFAASRNFLERYLCPRKEEVNDSERCWFEHVLARAVHQQLADAGSWSMTPEVLEIDGVSASLARPWNPGHLGRWKKKVKHQLVARGTRGENL